MSSVRPEVQDDRSRNKADRAGGDGGGEQPGQRFAPPVRRQQARGVGADTEKGGVAERNDAGVAQREVDGERENDGGEDLRRQRKIIRKGKEGDDGHNPRQRLERIKPMTPRETVEHGRVIAGRSVGINCHVLPKMPFG
jgi:hypothetical protein